MNDDTPITDLLKRYRAGDVIASQRLFERFVTKLSRLAARHLSPSVKRRADEDDVVQSAFRSFFLRDAKGEFHLENSLDLWKLLVTITLRKAQKAARTHSAGRRAVGREQSMDHDWFASQICREPTVVEALHLAVEINTLVAGLSPGHAEVLELRLAGHTVTEISQILEISRQAVYRRLNDLQAALAEALT